MRYLHIIIYVLFLNFGYSVIAQTHYLPENSNLSYNGKFIVKNENNDFRNVSENGLFGATYDIGNVTDEQRQIINFKLYKNETLLYSIEHLPGSDVYISNSGHIAIMDMNFHFKQELTVIILDQNGREIHNAAYKYASLFGFSSSGNKFVIGRDKNLSVIDLEKTQTTQLEACSKFAFSKDESIIATAKENQLNVYTDYQLLRTINTDLFYPRGLVILNNSNIGIIGKKELKVYNVEGQLINHNTLSENLSYRDLKVWNGKILAGVHYKYDGISKAILQVFDLNGNLIDSKEMAEKEFKTFKERPSVKSTKSIDPIPWPFFFFRYHS